MTKSKKLIALGVVFIVLCALTFLVMGMEKKEENIRNTDEIVLEIPYEDITNVKWKNFGSDEELSFTKNEKWTYDGDESLPVDEELMKKLLEPFEALGADFIIEEPEDMNQYGFKEPASKITISASQKEYDIMLGDFSKMDNQRYISTGDGNVYLIDEDPFPRFNRTATDFIDNDEIPEIDEISSLVFNGDDGFEIVRNEDEDRNTLREDDIFFTYINGEETPLDTTLVTDYVNVLKYMSLQNFVTYNADDEALAKYGLLEPELSFTVNFITRDDKGNEEENSVAISMSRDPEEIKKLENEEDKESDEEEKITAYMRVDDSPIIYSMIESDYKRLIRHSYNDFRHKEIIPCKFEDVKAIDIELDGKNYSLTSEIEEDARKWNYNGEEIDIADIKDSVNFLKASEFTNEKPGDKKEISLTFTMDFEDEPKVYTDIYRYDNENCLITIDGNSFALAERHKAVDLIEDINSVVLKKSASDEEK